MGTRLGRGSMEMPPKPSEKKTRIEKPKSKTKEAPGGMEEAASAKLWSFFTWTYRCPVGELKV